MSLQLVSSFREEAYPYYHKIQLKDPDNFTEREKTIDIFKRAVALANISDYKLLNNRESIALYLKTDVDEDRIKVAFMPYDSIEQSLLYVPEDYDFRKLKNRRNIFQRIIDQTELRGKVTLFADRENNRMVIFAEDKKSFFKFYDLLAAQKKIIIKDIAISARGPS